MSVYHYYLKIGKRGNLGKTVDKKWPETYKKSQENMIASRSKDVFGEGRNMNSKKCC